jgi:hypothetical protein
VWNETFNPISLPSAEGGGEDEDSSPSATIIKETMKIQLYDKGGGDMQPVNKLIGEGNYPINSLVKQQKENSFVEKWVPLSLNSRVTADVLFYAIVTDSRQSMQPTSVKMAGLNRGSRKLTE